jgi:glutamyl-tRNA reductase
MSSKEAVSKQTVEKIKEDVPNMSEEKTVQKAELEALIEKALSPLKVELTKANETIETYKAKELELTAATRLATLKATVKDEEKATSLAKSFANLTDEAFASTVETLKAIAVAGEAGEMFTEKGVDTELEEPAAKNYTREALEKQFAK